jgi:hypothetical protein
MAPFLDSGHLPSRLGRRFNLRSNRSFQEDRYEILGKSLSADWTPADPVVPQGSVFVSHYPPSESVRGKSTIYVMTDHIVSILPRQFFRTNSGIRGFAQRDENNFHILLAAVLPLKGVFQFRNVRGMIRDSVWMILAHAAFLIVIFNWSYGSQN